MAKKKSPIQTAIFQWAYQSRKSGNKTADVLRSLGEVEKTLDSVKTGKKP